MASQSATITTSQTAQDSSRIHFDPIFAKTIPGILKIAECALSLIGFICVQTIYVAAYSSAGGWYSFVSMSGFWFTLFLIVFYIFHIVEKFNWLPWLIIETGFAAIWSAFFFIAACVAAANARADPGWGAAAFFGFAAMIVFGYDAFRNYTKWRAGGVPQGEGAPQANNVESNMNTGPSYPTY